jgi:CheY-like chemotaxis protein
VAEDERYSVSGRGTVLVVEDEEDIRASLRSLLEAAGYAVATAADGGEALDHLRAASPLPVLILLDLVMPGMGGWSFLEERRQDPVLSAVPVVVLSAMAGPTRDAPYASVAALLRKPADPEVVLEAVRRFARSAG